MKVLVTAGNTISPVDQVRCITNVFTGRTGTSIAIAAQRRGHAVTLLTSHRELVPDHVRHESDPPLDVVSYRTFNDLQTLMEDSICSNHFDAIVHCAAVSDYQLAGVYAPADGTQFNSKTEEWGTSGGPPKLLNVAAGKVKSHHDELWLRMVPTVKLIDQVRTSWGFRGLLVKFKLEVGLSDAALIEVADRSRRHSTADLMVANTYESRNECAFLGPVDGDYLRLNRNELAIRLLEEIESRVAVSCPMGKFAENVCQ